jgi:hypothetical protein
MEYNDRGLIPDLRQRKAPVPMEECTIANYFSNKELKKAFPCTDYEITEARRHASFIGAGVTPPNEPRVTRYRIPIEDLAFVVNFLHHPDQTTLHNLLIEWLLVKEKNRRGCPIFLKKRTNQSCGSGITTSICIKSTKKNVVKMVGVLCRRQSFVRAWKRGTLTLSQQPLSDTRFRITLRVNVYNVNIYPPLKQNALLKSS